MYLDGLRGGDKVELTMRQARMLRDLTMEETAKKMGISPWVYGRIEANPDRITLAQAKRFCEIVDIAYNRIFLPKKSNKIGHQE
jgi:DNA-binding XRE family transcriptional regulator